MLQERVGRWELEEKKMIEGGGNIGTDRAKSLLVETGESGEMRIDASEPSSGH